MYRYTGRRQLPRYVNILNLTACNLQSVDKLQPSMVHIQLFNTCAQDECKLKKQRKHLTGQ